MQGAAWLDVRTLVVAVALAVTACAATPHPPDRTTRAPACAAPTWRPLAGAGERAPIAVAQLERHPELPIVGVSIVGAPATVIALATKPGQPLRDATIDADVRTLWALGTFADVRVELTAAGDGVQLTFVVTPHPRVDRVAVGTAPELGRLRSLAGGAFEPVRINRLADEIKASYVDEGYLDARVAVYRATAQPGIALCVDSDRGTRVHIGEITFAGRTKVSEAALREDLGIHPGSVANQQLIERAALLVHSVYWDHGMAKVRTGEPVLTRHRDRLDVEFRILDEGAVYHYGEIALENADGLVLPPTIAPGQRYSAKQLADVREALDLQLRGPTKVITSSMPYVVAQTKSDETAHTIGVTFAVKRP